MLTILLTGATGYIASHTWLSLLEAGYRVVGVDDFSGSSPVVLRRLARLAGQTPSFERADVCDPQAMHNVVERYRPDAVVHFASFKDIGESKRNPLLYYRNNLGCLVTVCEVLQSHGCKRLVFSSSATVYGKVDRIPITEDSTLSPASPYAAAKQMGERILEDLRTADPGWHTVSLRYFNTVGAHDSGQIGEDPRGTPSTLMPYIAQVAVGRREYLQVFGDDYQTPDGTGVRDYVHVLDVAEGHVAALNYLFKTDQCITLNLGTGRGHSVLEMVEAFESASGRAVPYRVMPRRPGDVGVAYSDPTRAEQLLGWRAKYDLARMCADSWRWAHMNPDGYGC